MALIAFMSLFDPSLASLIFLYYDHDAKKSEMHDGDIFLSLPTQTTLIVSHFS